MAAPTAWAVTRSPLASWLAVPGYQLMGLRPCCGHDTHRWIHAKAALRAGQYAAVLATAGLGDLHPVLRKSRMATRPPGLSTRATSPIAAARPTAPGNVVQGHAGDDDVEGLVVERQLAGVAITQLDPLGDPLRLGVGRPDQQQPAAAADVKDPLIAPPGKLVQEPVALGELAGPAAADHQPGLGDGDHAPDGQPAAQHRHRHPVAPAQGGPADPGAGPGASRP